MARTRLLRSSFLPHSTDSSMRRMDMRTVFELQAMGFATPSFIVIFLSTSQAIRDMRAVERWLSERTMCHLRL